MTILTVDRNYWEVVKSEEHAGKHRIASVGGEVKCIADNLDFSVAVQIVDEHTIVRRVLMVFDERASVTIEAELNGTTQILGRPPL